MRLNGKWDVGFGALGWGLHVRSDIFTLLRICSDAVHMYKTICGVWKIVGIKCKETHVMSE